MKIYVEFMGPVMRPTDDPEAEIVLDDGATVRDLLISLGYAAHQAKHVAVYREGTRLPHLGRLENGVRVTVAVAIGGG